jgi:hypothetical protein
MSTLEDFKNYVTSSGVDSNGLSDDKKGEWRERFDKSMPVLGINISIYI